MRLATIKLEGNETAGILTGGGVVPVSAVCAACGKDWATDLFAIIETGQLREMTDWHRSGGREILEEMEEEAIPLEKASFGPLFRKPGKIFGIGLNYKVHASDLAEKAPETEPASFFKPFTAVIGPGDAIKIPLQSEKTTAEAELGVVMGKACKDVEESDWLDYVAGFTTIIDMTAEDILRRNPRYLTRAKSFDTFFSFGPQLVTPDEIDDVLALEVSTVVNGEVLGRNVVANMTFQPDFLVSFHSKVMTLLPGDVISTGTPRAAHIRHGDVAECRIDGFEPLKNPVVDLKAETGGI